MTRIYRIVPIPHDLREETCIRLRLIGALLLQKMRDPSTPFWVRITVARRLSRVHSVLDMLSSDGL